jgi:hypothetical protein
MAGPFYNPAAGMGIEQAGASAVESPVAPVTTSAADALTAGFNLAAEGVSLYAKDQRYKNRYGGTRSGRPDPNLARFSEEVQIALRNKEQFGEGRFKMDMNRIVQNFGSAGQAIDRDMLTYFEQTTGLPSDTYFGVDPVEKFKAAQIQTPEIQAAAAPLIAAGMDPEKALNQALEEQQTFTRLSENLKRINTQNAAEYMAPKGGQETQQGIIQFFRDTAYSRLTALVNTGKATEQDARIVLSNYQALLATPKMQIPSGVSPEVRAQEVASRNNLKGSIETVVKLLDAGEQGQSLLQNIAQDPKMPDDDKKNMLARISLLSAKDPVQLMSFMGISDMNDLIKGNTALGKLPPSNFELGNLNSVTSKGLAKAPPGQTPPPEEIVPPELSDAIKKMSSSELVRFTQGNAKKASYPGWDFNSQEDVKAFATSMYSVAQGLTAPQQNRLRTIDDLGKLLNRNIFKNLDSLDKVDPEQAALLRASLGVGLTTELTRRKVQLSSIEKSLVGDASSDGITTAKFNLETGKYELTPEFINSQTPEDMKSFQVGVDYAYGGDLAKGAENNFVRLTTARSPNQGPGDASKVVSDGNLIRIEDAQRNRRATAALRQFYSSLDAGGQLPPLAQEFSDPSTEARRVAATVAGTAPMNQASPPPPAVEQPADQGIGTSPRPTNQRPEVTLTPTNRMTSAGRRLYETSEGELVSEKTTTVQDPNSKLWYNIPTINNGTMMSVDEAAELYLGKGEVKDVETGRVIQSFETIEEAENAARARSQELRQGQTMDQAPPPPIVQPAGATSGISSVTEAGAGFTTVTKADGTVVKREGVRNWRNNNPGNLEAGDFATSKGAIGSDGRFAVFKTYEEGREAMRSLLFEGKNYRTKTISEAITRYAPPKENDTDLYIKRVTDALGVSDSTKLSDLSNDQRSAMLDAMQKHEGFKEGTETVVEPSSGPDLVSRAGTAIGQALSSPAQAAPLPDSMLPPGFRSTDSQGRPFLRPEEGAEVTQGSMLDSLISSVRSALNLGSDEEARSTAEKLMQSGIIPRRPERKPMRLPPVRPTEQELAEANQLTPFESFIEKAKDSTAYVVNSMAELGQDITGTPDALAMMIKDVGYKNTLGIPLDRKTQTKSDLKASTYSALQDLAKIALSKGRMSIEWDDYGVDSNNINIKALIGGGDTKAADDFYPRNKLGFLRLAKTLMVDPKLDAALTIGGASLKKNDKGEIILTDTYDAEKFLKGSASGGIYGFVRNYLGKEGRLSLEKTTDSKIKWEVNLGKLEE